MKKFISTWMKNGRSGALVQSFMPALLSSLLAAVSPEFDFLMALLAVVGVEAAHLAVNLLDDYYDYKVDMKGDRDRVLRKGFRAMTVKYGYLTDGSQTLKTTWSAIDCFAAVALLCGAVIFVKWTVSNGVFTSSGSWWILLITAITAFLGYFYSAPPLKIAYHGLGELETGLIFGPLLMCGVHYAACGTINNMIVLVSVPVGLLVVNILFTHSFIDMAGDAESNKMTFARLVGSQSACLAWAFAFNLLPFAIVLAAVACGKLSPWFLLVLADLPRALWLCASLRKFCKGGQDVPECPPRMLGPMIKDWDGVRKAGIDWFLMRWFCARNILSGFCIMSMIAAIILIFQ